MSKKKFNMGDFDKRIKAYHLRDEKGNVRPWVLKIRAVGREEIVDTFGSPKTEGEILTDTEDDFNPYVDQASGDGKKHVQTKWMPVLWFYRPPFRNMLLNNTNRRTLINALGVYQEHWRDAVVTLHPSKTRGGQDTIILVMGGDYEKQIPAPLFEPKKQRAPEQPMVDLSELLNQNA